MYLQQNKMASYYSDFTVSFHHMFATSNNTVNLLQGQNECRFFMVWNHPKACPPYVEVPCSVRDEDGTLYDLSDLAWRSGNHEAHTNGKRSGLMLNVCRSVVFGRDSPCEPSAGACLHEGGK
jgi:hypothetical protein